MSLGSYTAAAKQLNICDSLLHEWKKKLGIAIQSKPAKALSETELELKRLRKENAQLKQVNYILKSATAFFSQDQLR